METFGIDNTTPACLPVREEVLLKELEEDFKAGVDFSQRVAVRVRAVHVTSPEAITALGQYGSRSVLSQLLDAAVRGVKLVFPLRNDAKRKFIPASRSEGRRAESYGDIQKKAVSWLRTSLFKVRR